jgi:polyphosphate kinase 2 (PPK2 family)
LNLAAAQFARKSHCKQELDCTKRKKIIDRFDASEDEQYESSLRELQFELVTMEWHAIKHDHRILVILEGSDASGKDGTFKLVASRNLGRIR